MAGAATDGPPTDGSAAAAPDFAGTLAPADPSCACRAGSRRPRGASGELLLGLGLAAALALRARRRAGSGQTRR